MRHDGRHARLASLLDGALDGVDEMVRKRVVVAVFGLSGHAIYYLLWTFFYPQPYESPVLRLTLGALFLAFFVPRRWIRRFETIWPAYWYVTFTLNLPFFFTYMALRNDTWLWVAGLQVALLLLYLLTSGALAALMMIVGMALAVPCAAPFVIDWDSNHVVRAWPVLLFSVASASVLSRSQLQHSRRKTAALMSYAGYIAHELRTPLASIAARAALTRLGTSAAAQEQEKNLAELSREVQRAFALIDILLTNVDPMRHASRDRQASGTDALERAMISDVVAQALMRYPFRDAGERARVQVRVMEDCAVRGSPLLLQHVVMNLVRNAFEHCRAGGAVVLGISARRRAHECELSIEDNGRGFQAGADHQAGLGLMFCRSVVRSIGGELRVLSPPTGGCTIRMSLPSAD